MKEKDKEAFLKSIKGTSPILKKNTLSKPIPKVKKPSGHTTSVKKDRTKKTINFEAPKPKKSIFKIEKTQINKKLKKGRIPIDKKIDFHGLSVFEAEKLFLKTIDYSYRQNLRCLLFITGKGILKKNEDTTTSPKLYYGKIRSSFFSWLKNKDITKHILSVEQADIKHGADGAFFVYLRKAKF